MSLWIQMFTKFSKLVRFNILLNFTLLHLYLLARKNKCIREITENEYFWELKLFHDYTQFKHFKPWNLEHYIRLYIGAAEMFHLTHDDTKDVKFTREEYSDFCLSEKNLSIITDMACEKYNCIRGDLLEIDALGGHFNTFLVIFDGKSFINVVDSYSNIVPKEFRILDEFPLMYWNGFCSNYVYIDKNLLQFDSSNVQSFQHTNNSYKDVDIAIMYCPVVVNSCTYYAICNSMRAGMEHKASFVELIKKVEYVMIGLEGFNPPLPEPFTVENSFIVMGGKLD